MLLRRIKVGIAADGDRKPHARLAHRHQCPRAERGVIAQLGEIVPEQVSDPRPCRFPCRAAERDECVELRAIEHALARRRDDKQPGLLQHGEVEHAIADRDAGVRARIALRLENTVGQILNRKLRVGRNLDERSQRGALRSHYGFPVKCFARPFQQSR